MNKPADLKPRNLSAAVRLRLNEIENWLDRGLTRHEIAEILDSEYSFSVTAKGLEMALYRTRQNRKNVLHNTHDRGARRVQRKVDCKIHKRLSLKRRKVKR